MAPQVSHDQIAAFAKERVNLPAETAAKHRAQVKALRERLEKKIDADPDYGLVKMLHAGSVAKGTALQNVNDLDTAVYVKSCGAGRQRRPAGPLARGPAVRGEHEHDPRPVRREPALRHRLLQGQRTRCRRRPSSLRGRRQTTVATWCASTPRPRADQCHAASAVHPGAQGEVRPELRRADPADEVVEAHRVDRDEDFRFKSFMIELLWAHLADDGLALTDYPTALERFFAYIVKSEFEEQVAFTDFCKASEIPNRSSAAIEVLDPVNADNNVAVHYDRNDRDRIVAAAHRALDAITEARFAPTKGRAVECWQVVLGPTFKG